MEHLLCAPHSGPKKRLFALNEPPEALKRPRLQPRGLLTIYRANHPPRQVRQTRQTAPTTRTGPPAASLSLIPPKENTHPLPPSSSFDFRISEVLASSLAKGTIANYQSAITSFTRFCDTHRIHENLRFPADEYVLCAFAASLAGQFSGSYAQSIFSGLRQWHHMHHVTWNGSPRLNLLIKGVGKLAPATSHRPAREPITTGMLLTLSQNLDTSLSFDAAVLAVALVAFWGQCRLGELLGSSRRTHDPRRFPSRSSVNYDVSPGGSSILQLPRTKCNQSRGEAVVLTRQAAPLDPTSAISHLLNLVPKGRPTSHLFSYTDQKTGDCRCLTKEAFLSRINAIWGSTGHKKLTGHSFRIGGTSALLKAGVPPEVVRSMGRWASDAHFRYWRDTSEIATQHAEFIDHPKPHKPDARPDQATSGHTAPGSTVNSVSLSVRPRRLNGRP